MAFILQEYVLVTILIMSILSNIWVSWGMPNCIPNRSFSLPSSIPFLLIVFLQLVPWTPSSILQQILGFHRSASMPMPCQISFTIGLNFGSFELVHNQGWRCIWNSSSSPFMIIFIWFSYLLHPTFMPIHTSIPVCWCQVVPHTHWTYLWFLRKC